MDIYGQLAKRIIKEQEGVIGPLALEQAKKVSGLSIDSQSNDIVIRGNKQSTIDELIERYQNIFGKASVEVCRNAVKSIINEIPKDQRPKLLQ